jgi:hypothetical protein
VVPRATSGQIGIDSNPKAIPGPRRMAAVRKAPVVAECRLRGRQLPDQAREIGHSPAKLNGRRPGSPTEMVSRVQMSGMMGDKPPKTDISMHSRWIAADCGQAGLAHLALAN